MTRLPDDGTDYAGLLYRLLPALYRARDGDGRLRTFLALFGHELERLRGNVDQLWNDFYIDSGQDWVVPYIGDLVGANLVFHEGARQRADVKNTIGWRRRKGTLPGLEDVAAVTSGWGAHAVEFFERLLWTQNLNHVRANAVHAVDLADGSRLARLSTPFDETCRIVDLRPPRQRAGWHRVGHLGVFVWPIASRPWSQSRPAAVDAVRWRFHPLGLDTALLAGGDRGPASAPVGAESPDICRPHADDVPIRGRDFHDHPLTYFGQPHGFTVHEDGIPLCRAAATAESRSTTPATDFAELAAERGMLVADASLFAGGGRFRVRAVRLAAATVVVDGEPLPVAYSPARAFVNQFVVGGEQGRVDTDTLGYAKGGPYAPGAPHHHHAALLLAVERTGADPDFPECEIIVRNDRGAALLVYLPALPALPAGQPLHLYVADDGSTYHARGTHDPGDVDRNPDAARFGAYLPRHLARAALGQARPVPGVRPVAFRKAVHRRLCCWDRPIAPALEPGDVAFDPERGRFAFPAGEAPAGVLTADFRFGMTGEVGAGAYARGALPAATLTVSRAGDADHAAIQDAIAAAPDGAAAPVVIEILDSHTYEESLTVAGRDFPGGLEIRARALAAPVLRSPGGAALSVDAASTLGRLVLDGLVVAGGGVSVGGAVREALVRFCSLEPATAPLDFAPAAGPARLRIESCIAGPVTASADAASVRIEDSIVHHPDVTVVDPGAHTAIAAVHDVELERATVLGATVAGVLRASNSILFGPATAGDAAASCLRYSRFHRTPGALPTFRCTAAFPVFASLRFGDPGYLHLHPNGAAELRRGAEEGGEMGAFHRAGVPWRLQSLGIKLEEYVPAGLRALPIRVPPTASLFGVRRT